jgi:hypothetical protein
MRKAAELHGSAALFLKVTSDFQDAVMIFA